MSNTHLSGADCIRLRELADEKLTEQKKQNDILRDQVFDILNQDARVLFYPLKDEDVWGFFEKINGNSFVCINSSIDIDKQVFVAAHELYHVWFNHAEELILASELEGCNGTPVEELKANRFAAEFLVPEMLLRREIRDRKIDDEIDVPHIVTLAGFFLVPYRTMVKRLFEIQKISSSKCTSFLQVSESEVTIWRKRLGITFLERMNKISLDNLIDKALSAYEKNQITKTKLEYLLSLADTNPSELGIPDDDPAPRPSDEELEALMED